MDAKLLLSKDDAENHYIYMERYVNNGSPSGFTDIHTTSDQTNPFIGVEKFPLLQFRDSDLNCKFLGDSRDLFNSGHNYAHPDSKNSQILTSSDRKLIESNLIVSPTSGGRTMYLRESSFSGYLKLTYDTSRIGRVDRQLSLKHCLSSLEASSTLKDSIDSGNLPPTFSILREPSAKISILENKGSQYEWGVIYREKHPYPYTKNNSRLVPGFSLFGVDRKNRDDDFLINQFISLSGQDPFEYLMSLLKLVVDCYWGVVFNCAFHMECHGQNCLFEIDNNFNIIRFVYKDMDSVDKDIPLAKQFGLRHEWDSYPVMCFDENLYFYSIRPSFMYDFKLGEYLLTPIIKVVASKYKLDVPTIEKSLQDYVRMNYANNLPQGYFPADGCWYDCDNSERKPGTKRKYYAHPNPKFR